MYQHHLFGCTTILYSHTACTTPSPPQPTPKGKGGQNEHTAQKTVSHPNPRQHRGWGIHDQGWGMRGGPSTWNINIYTHIHVQYRSCPTVANSWENICENWDITTRPVSKGEVVAQGLLTPGKSPREILEFLPHIIYIYIYDIYDTFS